MVDFTKFKFGFSFLEPLDSELKITRFISLGIMPFNERRVSFNERPRSGTFSVESPICKLWLSNLNYCFYI